jgi:hypothetical protein
MQNGEIFEAEQRMNEVFSGDKSTIVRSVVDEDPIAIDLSKSGG